MIYNIISGVSPHLERTHVEERRVSAMSEGNDRAVIQEMMINER